MIRRNGMSTDVWGRAVIAICLAGSIAPIRAQKSPAVTAPADWSPALTSDRQPDIQGYWNQRNNVTTYSLERGDEDRFGYRLPGGPGKLGDDETR